MPKGYFCLTPPISLRIGSGESHHRVTGNPNNPKFPVEYTEEPYYEPVGHFTCALHWRTCAFVSHEILRSCLQTFEDMHVRSPVHGALQRHALTAGLANRHRERLMVFRLTAIKRETSEAGIPMVHSESDGLPKSLAGLVEKQTNKHKQNPLPI